MVAVDGFILLSMIIFIGITNLTVKDIVTPEHFVIVTQKKALIDEFLTVTTFENVWQTYAKEKQKELGFHESFIVYDAFKPHKTGNVKVLLTMNNINLVPVSLGCTSKCQLLDVRTNEPYNGVLCNFWEGNIILLLALLVPMSLTLLLISPKLSSNQSFRYHWELISRLWNLSKLPVQGKKL